MRERRNRVKGKTYSIAEQIVQMKRKLEMQKRQQFQVVYETKGVKVVNVWLPEGTQLPTDWNTMTYEQQDAWLYDNQDEAHLQWTDEHEGVAVNVLPIAQLKAV
jgi:hypothetical protein